MYVGANQKNTTGILFLKIYSGSNCEFVGDLHSWEFREKPQNHLLHQLDSFHCRPE